MKHQILTFSFSALIVSLLPFAARSQQQPGKAQKRGTVVLTLQPAQRFQTIDNFGASGCWFSEGIGKYWPQERKDSIARYLFSKEFDRNGDPMGIGLSAWRFNIGGGTAEQGINSGIKTSVKRIESFIDSTGNYNWSKQSGYQWFVQQAKAYGVENLIAFSNTPPVHFTKNHLGFKTEKDYTCNLDENKYVDYAVFLANVLKHFAQQGIHYRYVSPVNEPQWDWSNKFGEMNQEGTPWKNENIYRIVRLLDSVISAEKIDSRILMPEAATLRHLYTERGHAAKQVQYFFGNTETSVKLFRNVLPVVAGHSYFTDLGDTNRITIRENLRDTVAAYNTSFWQSEYSMLGDGYREKKKGKIPAIDCALFLAKLIHGDLTSANAAAWQLWNVYEPGSAEFDTRYYLMALESNDSNTTGYFRTTKNLWAMGHFSRFIRPGMTRIGISRSDKLNELAASQDLMCSAFQDKGGKTVMVLINYSEQEKSVNLQGLRKKQPAKIYTTTAAKEMNMKKSVMSAGGELKLLPRSINTLVIGDM
ncbi:MAG: glycoside hydrolase [Flavitalea sp.]